MIQKLELIIVLYGIVLLALVLLEVITFETFAYLGFFGLVVDRVLLRMNQNK